MSQNKIHIFQFATNQVCAPYRLDAPGRLLSELPNIQVTRFNKLDRQTYTSLIEKADILILQRMPMSPGLSKVISAVKRAGKIVAFEIDDDLLNLDPASRFAKLAPADYGERIKQTILASQTVQCSTPHLAAGISELHPEVVVLGNQLENLPPFLDKKITGRPIVIGYAAGEDHWLDWLPIKDSYNRIIEELEQSGHRIETWVIGDETIFNSLSTAHKKYFPLLSREKYDEVLQCFDISLVPLSDTKFNRSKSDVKFLESTACSCAVIASETVYSHSILHRETGLIFSEPNAFEACLKRLVTRRDEITVLARNAYQYVQNHRLLALHISKWAWTYRMWVEK